MTMTWKKKRTDTVIYFTLELPMQNLPCTACGIISFKSHRHLTCADERDLSNHTRMSMIQSNRLEKNVWFKKLSIPPPQKVNTRSSFSCRRLVQAAQLKGKLPFSEKALSFIAWPSTGNSLTYYNKYWFSLSRHQIKIVQEIKKSWWESVRYISSQILKTLLPNIPLFGQKLQSSKYKN